VTIGATFGLIPATISKDIVADAFQLSLAVTDTLYCPYWLGVPFIVNNVGSKVSQFGSEGAEYSKGSPLGSTKVSLSS
jgi:hypothetical protein